jgi:multicomponent Na+:H+ antiporter subunit B
MTSIILRTATRYLFPVIMLFSVYLLLRGHNEPGGGFVGGLAAASAFTLYALAFDANTARNLLRVDSRDLIAFGLLVSMASGLLSFIFREPYLSGTWWKISILQNITVELGTPFFFDVGVYCVVLGVTLTIILALAEERKEAG